MKAGTVKINHDRLVDGQGRPTCACGEDRCQFYRSLIFDSVDACAYFKLIHALYRREDGQAASVIPADECPIWAADAEVAA